MKYVLTHYQGDTSWTRDYTDDTLIYNRSGDDIEGSIKRENKGDADYDRLSYIVDNYYSLPDTFLLAKSNLFKYCPEEEFRLLKDSMEFTQLGSKNHKTYSDSRGVVCFYQDGWYMERNDSWYLNSIPARYVSSWNEWADMFGLPKPDYIPFCPGGNYILTKDVIHKYSIDFYDKMRSMLPYSQRPGEAQCAERSYGLMWM